jgi:hypothetical protein
LASGRGEEYFVGYSYNACERTPSNLSLLSMENVSMEASNNLYPEF